MSYNLSVQVASSGTLLVNKIEVCDDWGLLGELHVPNKHSTPFIFLSQL